MLKLQEPIYMVYEPPHEISNNPVCATSECSDKPSAVKEELTQNHTKIRLMYKLNFKCYKMSEKASSYINVLKAKRCNSILSVMRCVQILHPFT